jgi:hypothetical protein
MLSICRKQKKEAISHRMVMTTLGVEFDEFTILLATGMHGGILMAWKSSVCRVIAKRVDVFCCWFSLNSRKVLHGGLLVCVGLNPMR